MFDKCHVKNLVNISKNKIELNEEIGSKIPNDLVELTTNRYVQLYEILTGLEF